MQRQVRNYIATACFALCIAGFPSYLWLFFQYQSTRPDHPQPDLGFVHALNNHGSYVYINDVESTGLSLLMGSSFVGFMLFLIVVLKTYTSKGIEHDLINPTPQQQRVLWDRDDLLLRRHNFRRQIYCDFYGVPRIGSLTVKQTLSYFNPSVLCKNSATTSATGRCLPST